MNSLILTMLLLVAAAAAYGIGRCLRLQMLQQRARERLAGDEKSAAALGEELSHITGSAVSPSELAAYAGVTAAEFAWSWAAIDPDIIRAADFASAEHISNGFDFAQYLHAHYDALGAVGQEGFAQRLLGYVGEQRVAQILEAQGHIVQLADTANQPVWDLIVDGHTANVKTVADVASIKGDALAHPDTTYIVPEDAHGEAAHNVMHLAGFRYDAAHESLHDGIASAHGDAALHGLMHHVPWITIGFAIARNYKAVQNGTDPLRAAEHAGLEVVGRGGGVLIGAKAGAVIGLAFGPVGTLAMATLGAMAGSVLGNKLALKWKARRLRAALSEMEAALEAFGASFADRLDQVRGFLHTPLTRMTRSMEELAATVARRKASLRWLIWPDFYTVLLDEAHKVGEGVVQTEKETVARLDGIIDGAQASGRYARLGLVMVNSPVVCELVGFDPAALERINQARSKALYERKQLYPGLTLPA